MLPIVLLILLTSSNSNAETIYSCNASAPCGCSKRPVQVSRILGGENALNNTWGWAVSLLFNNSFYCGGSLISSSWIVTAAGCIGSIRPWEIAVSAATNQFFGWQQWRYASAVFKHPSFDTSTFLNDIALIKVSPPFNMTDVSIAQICLPMATTDDYPPVNSSASDNFLSSTPSSRSFYFSFFILKLTAIGWGITTQNGAPSTSLQQVTLQRVSYSDSACSQIIANRSSVFCSGSANGSKGDDVFSGRMSTNRIFECLCGK